MEEIQNKRGNPNNDSKRSRRDDSQKLLRMDIIAPLFKRGYTYREIRDEVMKRLALNTYSLSTVKHDVERILEEWRETRIDNTDMAVQLELTRIDDMVKEAWTAWDRSKENYQHVKKKAKHVPSVGGGGEVRAVSYENTSEDVHTCGDPRFLDVINKLLMERRKLLGLYPKEKMELDANMTFADFLMITGRKKDEE